MLRGLLLASLVALAGAPACGSARCNLIIECNAPLVVDAQIPLPISAVNGLTLSFCRNHVCATGPLANGAAVLVGGGFSVVVVAENRTTPMTDLIFTPAFNGFVNGSGDVSDGDEYEVQVKDGANVILDNTRKVDFAHGSAGCRDGSCYSAGYIVSPTSASGIECHMNGCPVDVATLHGTFSASGTTVDVTVCRNAGCQSGPASLPSDDEQTTPSGGGLLLVELGKSGTGFSIDVDATLALMLITDPYHDGDTYAVTVTQGSVALLSNTRTVTYDKTFPNGASCDPTPCLSATVNLN